MSIEFREPFPVRPVSYGYRTLPLIFRSAVRETNSGGARQPSKCTPSLSQAFAASMSNNHFSHPAEPHPASEARCCKGARDSSFPRRGRRLVK